MRFSTAPLAALQPAESVNRSDELRETFSRERFTEANPRDAPMALQSYERAGRCKKLIELLEQTPFDEDFEHPAERAILETLKLEQVGVTGSLELQDCCSQLLDQPIILCRFLDVLVGVGPRIGGDPLGSLILRALLHVDAEVRVAAANYIETFMPEKGEQWLTKAIEQEKNPHARSDIQEALRLYRLWRT